MSNVRATIAFFAGLLLVFTPIFGVPTPFAQADSEIDSLKAQIEERNSRLSEISKEIAGLEADLQKVGAEKSTLQSAINKLELERKKVQADISYTQNKIGSTDLEISKLTYEISDTERVINQDKNAVGEILRRLDETDQGPLIVSMLRYNNLSEFWDEIASLEQVRDTMRSQVTNLVAQKNILEDQQLTSTQKRTQLIALKDQYSDQNKILSSNKAEKDQLLQETQNKESSYQTLLAQKRATFNQLTKEVSDFESKLQFILDPNTIPPAGTAVFNWPLDKVIITQYFGGTEFAARNAAVYGGRAYHPGVDFGAVVGTPIHAPLSGTVRATGNTDEVSGCLSWGKWTLIDHANGLTTLYAHQSVISVTPGQQVKTGDIIGYTGNTGYTTGPHLHFTVYAKYNSDGTLAVSVQDFKNIKSVTSCGGTRTPVAATAAYLDPMNYLPAY